MSLFRKSSNDDMQISNAELKSMTDELDMLHKETFPSVQKTLNDVAANMAHLRSSGSDRGLARRGFLTGVGGVAVLGAVAACSSSGSGSGSSDTNAPSTGTSSGNNTSSKYTGDFKVVALAAALENLAVAAYGLALSNAAAGKYGSSVPDAIGQFATVAMAQHKDHAGAWNSVLSKSKLPTVTTPAVSIADQAVADLKKQTSIAGVAKQALGLEDAAAATYLFAIENVESAGGIQVASTIEPVETMHAAILNFVLGQYPVPASFITTSGAAMPSMLTA